MILIPGQIISAVTFPGVIVHEISHQFFCRLFKIPVFDVCYFRVGNPAGYVVHEDAYKVYKKVLIGVGPFIINTIIGALVGMSVVLDVIYHEGGGFLNLLLLWLGISIAMHAFPSTGDAKSIWHSLKNTNILGKIIGAPIVALIYIGAIGSVVWLDVLYGVAICMGIPLLLTQLLA